VSVRLAAEVREVGTPSLGSRPGEAYPRDGRRRGGGVPAVWVLEDDKLGHSTQSVGLAEALGWPYARKQLRFNALNRVSNLLLRASLLTLDRRRSDPLSPPWPDLVIATGRRVAPVARWIRTESRGRTRLVQLGRKGVDRADDFDLSVTCSHFAMPPHPRRVETRAPLTAIDDARLRAARERWRGLFGSGPGPHVGLIVGGTSALHRLDAETAARLGREVAAFVRAAAGSLFVVTSPRTGAAAGSALRASLDGGDQFYQWHAGDADNPYLGCLAVAGALVVTGDSESMLAEAAATGTPLYIYPLPERRKGLRHHLRTWVSQRARGRAHAGERTGRSRLQALCARLIDTGLVRTSRDLGALHRCLIEAGDARPFGAPLDERPHAPLRELDRVAERVRALLEAPVADTVG
jgi:uncharacterized protein